MDLNFFSCLLPKLRKELTKILEIMLFQNMEVSKSVTNKSYYKNLIKKSKKEATVKNGVKHIQAAVYNGARMVDRFRIFLAAKK